MTRADLAAILASASLEAIESFDDDGARFAPEKALVPASVLIAVIDRPAGPTVPFTQRTAHLNDHAGQISFPGGRAEPGDADAFQTALREAEEEVGLAPQRVNVLGRIPPYVTGTGFQVTPVVGWVEPPVEFRLDAFEVAEVFEVPLDFLLDPRNHRAETAILRGRLRTYYAMPYEGRYIWGATAGMLRTLYRVIARARGEPVRELLPVPHDSG